jgi:hypothetical protein
MQVNADSRAWREISKTRQAVLESATPLAHLAVLLPYGRAASKIGPARKTPRVALDPWATLIADFVMALRASDV